MGQTILYFHNIYHIYHRSYLLVIAMQQQIYSCALLCSQLHLADKLHLTGNITKSTNNITMAHSVSGPIAPALWNLPPAPRSAGGPTVSSLSPMDPAGPTSTGPAQWFPSPLWPILRPNPPIGLHPPSNWMVPEHSPS